MFRASEAHLNAVTCMATSVSGKFVASGSSDETVRVFDMVQLKDYSALYGHEGGVTCLDFFKVISLSSPVVSASICFQKS